MSDYQERIAKAIQKMRDTPTLLQWDERLAAKIERALRAAAQDCRGKPEGAEWCEGCVTAGIEELERP